ncbi:MAG: SUMF1/EgtB/PvdO family nonheme iron enzyme [Verrucomicrobiales bacterium]|nr:SUMF1/EgtB/PvdO family nonheme iron enzyme [Verrucomicrobiales bacterium]
MPNPLILKPGQLVGPGRFTLIRELGRGGMGVVWLAQDTSLGEQVALKFLPPEVCHDPVALNDLRRETVKSHRLTHPNVIRIHDFHQQPDGVAFISMEYVDGMTLSGWRLQQQKQVFPWPQLAPLVQQLCAALQYAHGEGVIHRDLKPANVMVDTRGRVKLADFGIAAVVSDSMSRVSARSSSGGTLAYMSPQQLRGHQPSVGDDIYALGASLYELLTGRPPFYTGDITHQVLNEAPAPLVERALDLGVDNPVPPEVGALVMACLGKEVEQRPASAEAVAAWVGLVEQPAAPVQQVAAALASPVARDEAESWQPELEVSPSTGAAKKWLWPAIGVAAVLLLAGLGWLLWGGKGGEWKTTTSSSPAAARGERWTNSLGMVFVPVPGTEAQFSIWETRVQDFQAFVTASGFEAGQRMFAHRRDGWRERDGCGWSNPGFNQGPNHPVVGVNWDEAQAFCQWLTVTEQTSGKLKRGQQYRLPTDAEWSQAVGNSRYPWGDDWPPGAGAGNYGGTDTRDGDFPQNAPLLQGYADGFSRTSPVGSFQSNRFGIYDLGGNVWEWCSDWYRKEINDPSVLEAFPVLKADRDSAYRIYRGGGWNDRNPSVLLSANRMGDGYAEPAKRYDNTGFRVVLASGELSSAVNAAAPPPGTSALRYGLYLHFDVSTFAGYEPKSPDFGKANVNLYRPKSIDAGQWARTAREAGMTFAVLTAKHEAGFCLWDAADYDYDVAASPVKTDVLAAFLEACEAEGILPGVHYSIPDARNEGSVRFQGPVGSAYFDLIRKQLSELHTFYPGIRVQILDTIQRLSIQQQRELTSLIKRLNSACVILGTGDSSLGPMYTYATVNRNWLWSPTAAIVPSAELLQRYRQAVQNGQAFILNVGVDPQGRIPTQYVDVLMQLRHQMQATALQTTTGNPAPAVEKWLNALAGAEEGLIAINDQENLARVREIMSWLSEPNGASSPALAAYAKQLQEATRELLRTVSFSGLPTLREHTPPNGR